MLDFRHETFLTLYNVKNYTKAAEILHITQPAVTQHIQFLESYYGVKFFSYEKKSLIPTKEGEQLYEFIITVNADSKKIKKIFIEKSLQRECVSFGTTLTIGEYIMPSILKKIIQKNLYTEFTMLVDNTQVLLQKLEEGVIDFIILEGFFDKSKYDFKLFSKEKFIPICSNISDMKERSLDFSEIFRQNIILREKGSGTRNIFEQILYRNNLRIEAFNKIIEIGNISVIKQLVQDNLGITFLYKVAVEKELLNKTLYEIEIEDFSVKYEFNFVFLKGSVHKEEYLKWYNLFKKLKKA